MKSVFIITALAVTLAGCTENVYNTTFVEPVYRPTYSRPIPEYPVEYRAPLPVYGAAGPTVILAPPFVGGPIYAAPRTYVPRPYVYRHAPVGHHYRPHVRPTYPVRHGPRHHPYR